MSAAGLSASAAQAKASRLSYTGLCAAAPSLATPALAGM
jgi:hypothetical protein